MSSIRVLIDNEQRITTKINKTRATVHFNRRQTTSTLDEYRFPLVSILTVIPKALTFVGQETTFQHQQISMQGQFLNEFVDETRFLHDLLHLCPNDFNHRLSFRPVQFHEPESSEMWFVIVPIVEDLINRETGVKNERIWRTCWQIRSVSRSDLFGEWRRSFSNWSKIDRQRRSISTSVNCNCYNEKSPSLSLERVESLLWSRMFGWPSAGFEWLWWSMIEWPFEIYHSTIDFSAMKSENEIGRKEWRNQWHRTSSRWFDWLKHRWGAEVNPHRFDWPHRWRRVNFVISFVDPPRLLDEYPLEFEWRSVLSSSMMKVKVIWSVVDFEVERCDEIILLHSKSSDISSFDSSFQEDRMTISRSASTGSFDRYLTPGTNGEILHPLHVSSLLGEERDQLSILRRDWKETEGRCSYHLF